MTNSEATEYLRIGIANKQYPTHLFQYRTIEICKLILENNTMKFSSPKEFNDPFDCQIVPDTENTFEQVVSFLNENNFYNLSVPQIKNLAEDTMKTPEKWKNTIEQTFDKIINATGVCCFTKEENNLLMWSHYTNSHKGVCLKFNVLKDLDFFVIPFPVKYSDQYPTYNHLKDRTTLVNDMVLTKSKIWEYENEIRVIKLNKTGYINFKKGALEEIVFGCNTTDQEINEIKNLALKHDYNIIFKKANKKQRQFGLEII